MDRVQLSEPSDIPLCSLLIEVITETDCCIVSQSARNISSRSAEATAFQQSPTLKMGCSSEPLFIAVRSQIMNICSSNIWTNGMRNVWFFKQIALVIVVPPAVSQAHHFHCMFPHFDKILYRCSSFVRVKCTVPFALMGEQSSALNGGPTCWPGFPWFFVCMLSLGGQQIAAIQSNQCGVTGNLQKQFMSYELKYLISDWANTLDIEAIIQHIY